MGIINFNKHKIMGPKKKAGGDATKGAELFKSLCAICHSMNSNVTGPALKGAYGRNPGGSEGFGYSGALTGKGKWGDKTLDKYLKSPADYAPGNSMAFAGVPNAKDRGDLVAYLKSNK